MFVHVTAADAAHGADTIGRHWPYFLARDNSAEKFHGHVILTARFLYQRKVFIRV